MFIIQTNTSLNSGYQPVDFQSLVYQIKNQTWEEFKDYILSEEAYTDKIIHGTMQGITKPRNMEIKEILINTEHHLEVVMEYGQGLLTNSKYYMVKEDNFNMFIDLIKR